MAFFGVINQTFYGDLQTFITYLYLIYDYINIIFSSCNEFLLLFSIVCIIVILFLVVIIYIIIVMY